MEEKPGMNGIHKPCSYIATPNHLSSISESDTKMAFASSKTHLTIFNFFSLIILIHARLNLDCSDLKAFSIIQKDLGISRQLRPCSSPGVFCERSLSSNNTYVLRITRLIFTSQRLTGLLSPTIGQLSELKEFSISNNLLVGQLPPQIVECQKLEILDLKNNQFFGEIPVDLSLLNRLRILNLSSNKFSGNLSFLKYFPNLENLSLADNQFTGKIPTSISSFRNLRFSNFSGNCFLEGSVPMINGVEYSSSDFPKRYVFSEIKTTESNTTAAVGPSGGKPSSTEAPGLSTPLPEQEKKKRKPGRWILWFFVGVLAGSLSGFLLSLLLKLVLAAIRGRGKDSGNSGPAIFSLMINKADLAFLEKDNTLESLEIIGRGGCGEVYRSELPLSNGIRIAIKKIVQPPKDAAGLNEEDTKMLDKKMRQIRSEIQTAGLKIVKPAKEAAELTEEDTKMLDMKMRQIRSEIRTVGRIRHRNLVPLLAHVSRPDCHYLVYEFMKNGSLQDVLSQVSQGTRELGWLSRYKIALGVATGLEYLHMSHNPLIIHRDLKPANILLDDDMEARIADFGLAKAMPDAKSHLTASNLAGTVGYIAPEYHQTLKFTDKCDIYSFGVILGVLVMGKLPYDDFFEYTAEMILVKWMRNVMTSENPQQAIDQNLMGNGFEEQMLHVLRIACFCTLENPKQRPNSRDVRSMLSRIKH